MSVPPRRFVVVPDPSAADMSDMSAMEEYAGSGMLSVIEQDQNPRSGTHLIFPLLLKVVTLILLARPALWKTTTWDECKKN